MGSSNSSEKASINDLDMQDYESSHNGDEEDKTEKKYGKAKQYDSDWKGPIENRGCTDTICCFLFVLLIVAMAIVGILGFSWGNPKRLLYPTDTHGNSCGEGEFSDRKNLFFFDLLECVPKNLSSLFSISSCPSYQICVKDCPSKNTMATSPTTPKSDLYCRYDTQRTLNTTTRTNAELVASGECARYTIESEPLAHRCIPNVIGKQLSDWLVILSDSS